MRLLQSAAMFLVPCLVVGLGVGLASGPAEADGNAPPLTVPTARLAAATHCDTVAESGTGRQTVLLIHGTGATPEEAWSWNYQIALSKAGYGICTVTLPNRALSNFSVASEYAVYAARHAYQRSGRKIAIIGHSQG